MKLPKIEFSLRNSFELFSRFKSGVRFILWCLLLPLCYFAMRYGKFHFAWHISKFPARFHYCRVERSRCLENLSCISGELLQESDKLILLDKHIRTQVLLMVNRGMALVEANISIYRYVNTMIYPHAQVNDPMGLQSLLTKQGCVLALTHTGDHFSTISILARSLIGTNRKLMIVLRSDNKYIKRSNANLSKITGADVTCVGIDRIGLQTIIRALKDPLCHLAFYYDLPAQSANGLFDSVRPCNFLGSQAYMADGLWRIVARCSRPIIYAGGTVNQHGYTLNYLNFTPDSSQQSVAFETAASTLEIFLRKHPECWLYLSRFELFRHTPILPRNKALKEDRANLLSMQRRWQHIK